MDSGVTGFFSPFPRDTLSKTSLFTFRYFRYKKKNKTENNMSLENLENSAYHCPATSVFQHYPTSHPISLAPSSPCLHSVTQQTMEKDFISIRKRMNNRKWEKVWSFSEFS